DYYCAIGHSSGPVFF
nr:immunoglobulin light chain junction region [Macaca mulatta]MOX69017.1 immunoglobulin light chain junction region [Macaca mulatta]MOX69109.1 immunoglobulin light chain junction region [Macaca mulatta]MOX69141.1 immunoglobulin light chain junction region [Macaca mulatta]MOX69339.1 immunoglobulin light chain junction region [Macaca mulatta]